MRAVIELIWNGLDAEAHSVTVDVELDGPGIPLTAHQCSGSGS
ncbi:Uncharacterised protein [Mycobacteroides abscessus subsp. abscessus]|nr:Uncharacterised protein [Mycobacteroides abscessus subsp. abscessus]